MIDQVVIIRLGDVDVTSMVEFEPGVGASDKSRVAITSECEATVQTNHMVLFDNADYTEEQFAYDVEQARFQFAREVAGRVRARQLGVGQILGPSGLPAVLTEPGLSRPERGGD